MQDLIRQQHDGFSSKHRSVLHPKQLRRQLHDGLLRHLETVAVSADAEALACMSPPARLARIPAAVNARDLTESL